METELSLLDLLIKKFQSRIEDLENKTNLSDKEVELLKSSRQQYLLFISQLNEIKYYISN